MVLVAATVASCSSPGSAAVNVACATPGITADGVELGLVLSGTGSAGPAFSSARSGVDARLGLANEAGGVHGREVGYEWRDDETSSSVNSSVVEDLVEREEVFGLVTASPVVSGSM
nr:ABC transporter substrate-binding protein [Micromonospora sp. DSM 115978]